MESGNLVSIEAVNSTSVSERSVRRSHAFRLAASSLASVTYALLAGTAAQAQIAEETVEKQSSEIIVTALRRDERLQDASAAITVLPSDTLTRMGVTDFYDYYRAVPSLQITANPVTPGQARISLRGIYAAGEATTGLYYGETPVTGPSGSTADSGWQTPSLVLFDLERIEVLRGPQGTLYGSGSVGGTIRVLFARPDPDRWSGTIAVQGSTTEHGGEGGHVRGALNIPLIDGKLAARVVGYTERSAGYVDNIRTGQDDINKGSVTGGRISLAYTPDETLELTGTAIYQKSRYDDAATWFQSLGRKAYRTDAVVKVPYKDEFRLFNGTLNWTLPFAKLTVASSYYEWDLVREADATPNLWTGVVNTPAASPLCQRYNGISVPCSAEQFAAYKAYGASVLPGSFHTPIGLEAQAHEARLASTGGGWIDWAVGIFYEKRKDRADSYLAQADPATGSLLEPHVYNGYRFVQTDFSQFSQFGELSVRPLEGLTLTAGARHYSYDKEVSGQVLENGYIFGSFVGPLTSQKASKSGWVGKLETSYKFTDDILGYATWAQGFRPGGANNVPGLAASQIPYQPDSLDSYEIGLKTSWTGGRFTLNIAAFQIDWSDIQANLTVEPAFRITVNAGDARIRGIEVEAAAHPISGLSITGGLNYTPVARLTSSQSGGGIIVGPQNGLAGDRLPYTSRFNGSLAVDYQWALATELDAFVRVDATHRSRSASEFRPTFVNYEVIPGFTQLNAKVGLQHGGWTGNLFVDNLTGAVGALAVQSFSVAVPYQQERMLGSLRPRTFGISLSRDF